MSPSQKIIGITPGDPAGVGPELIAICRKTMELPSQIQLRILGADTTSFAPGVPTRESAQFALAALEEAAQLLKTGKIHAVVTGPVSKAALAEVGFAFPGQTEFFAARAGVSNFAMCLTGGALTVGLVTIHEPLAAVAGMLTQEEIMRTGRLLLDFLRRRNIPSPRLAVAGLNPHAGENGRIGQEEKTILLPAIERLRSLEPDALISSPLPPDTVFRDAIRGGWDAVLCMYHDQGLIPLKLVAFDEGVNVTLGLPFARTSPDHGTAFSIAGKGIARPDSFQAAIRLAAELALSE